MAQPMPVWLDCDPGHDDAMAILLAGHTPGLKLLGVSTVGGNQTLEKVTRNALDVLDAIGLNHIDVVAGQARPLMRPSKLCPEIHGDSGLDGPSGGRLLPRSQRKPLTGKAVNVMYDAISAAYQELQKEDACTTATLPAAAPAATAHAADATTAPTPADGLHHAPRKVKLVCTGALTNAALLLTLYPEVAEQVEVVLMGGCMGVGNTGPVMEFNIQTDPEAARIVFEFGMPITMVPLEVTHTVLATPEVLAAIGSGRTNIRSSSGSSVDNGGSTAACEVGLDADAPCTGTTATSTPSIAPSEGGDVVVADAQGGGGAAAAAEAEAGGTTGVNGAGSRGSNGHGSGSGCNGVAPSPFRHTIQQLLLFFAKTYRRVFRFEHPPLHDPVAVAYVIRPDHFECQHMRVDVETVSQLSYGQTVCDVWGQSRLPPNVNVALRVDVAGFWEVMLEAVGRADAVSPLKGSR
ncbi:hypothetical protein Agub_g2492 [Astrephomene gubernaculifera]|uniref:Inosine/uridine-preferring nucleoside hydrolase domain-containing protein n=1 Tax=Astrephomene gubernaculifera TaxID=47775 RepID=A0AAD3DIB4_9CHLO|nr:hypothetical protein Agub_g2492 [Astrephomene gubernaculifera]